MGIATNDESFSNPNVTYWDANRIINTFNNAVIMNPYIPMYENPPHPLHYLMYTLNQITDHFASGVSSGDDNYNTNYPSSDLMRYFPYGKRPTNNNDYQKPADMITIRDATFPHAIRATAGLLYWFAKEADILPKPMTAVSIGGQTQMYNEGNYYYWATPQNGYGPFTYKWEMRKIGTMTAKIGIRAAPSDVWLELGLTTDYIKLLPPNNGDWRDFEIRCTVTDVGSGVVKTSNALFVDVENIPYPQGNMVTKDSENQSIKAEESIEIEQEQITEAELEDCYPNPFNPVTTIGYKLSEAGMVTLKIYNTLGQEVAVLVNEQKPAGKYQVQFNAVNLPSGVYFSKLQTSNKLYTKKLLLTK